MCLSTSGNYTQVEILTAGTVEKNSSTIRSTGRNRTYAVQSSAQAWVPFLPEDLIVDEFFSTVPGKNFDKCIISTRTKTH